MATSAAQVANLALGAIGQRQLIDSLTEDSPEAASASLYFDQSRLEVLSAWHWKFATKRATLALSTETRSDWAFCYVAPSDMLVARCIWNGRLGESNIPFTKELSDDGTSVLILTDQASAELVYTAKAPALGLWPPHFTSAVALRLASYMAAMLPVNPALSTALDRRAIVALLAASRLDANEGKADVPADSEFIRVR